MSASIVRSLRRQTWLIYLSVGALALALFLFDVLNLRLGPLFNVIGLSSPIVIVIAVKLHRPEHRLPWYLVAIGQTLFILGDVITYNYHRFFGTELPFPSPGDILYLSVYPFLVLGILLLIRARTPGRDSASLIDSLIVCVGVGTLSWVFLISPYFHDPTLTLQQKLVAMAYPLMDLILFTVAVRLTVGGGKRPAAFYLMVSSVAVLFITDSIYGWLVLHGGYDNTAGYLEGGWGLFYLLWGAAALHPSMRTLEQPTPAVEPKRPRRRIMLLASASLVSPLVRFIESVRNDTSALPVLAASSAVVFVLVLVRLNGLMVDIGQHRRTERQLRDAETKYRSLVEGLPAVVYIAEFGEEGAWRYVSPQIQTILGFSREHWMEANMLWRDRIIPEDRQRALDAEQQLLNGEGRMHCEYRIRGADDHQIWIREEAEALPGDDGRPMYLQGVMYDVSDQKAAEEQLVKALETEKDAADGLRRLHDMHNSFLQAVSHDLRTPLTSIMGSALTLERDDGKISQEDAKDLISRIAANAQKLHRLLTNLLDLDRITRGIVEPKREHVDLGTIVIGVLQECTSDTHPLEFLTTEPVWISVDAAQIERIVENLVINAMRYTPAGTPISVSLFDRGDGVILTVADSGPGIPEELWLSIFEPFRQGNEVIPHSPGVGIGLSLVSRFAELHGGRAWVEDRPGGGASFRVFLPHPKVEHDAPVAPADGVVATR